MPNVIRKPDHEGTMVTNETTYLPYLGSQLREYTISKTNKIKWITPRIDMRDIFAIDNLIISLELSGIVAFPQNS